MEHKAIGQPLSEAETTILGIIDGVNAKFKYTALNPDPSPHELFNVPYNKLLCTGIIGSQPSFDNAVLLIGQNLLHEAYEVHRAYPDVVKAALSFEIEHEAAHVNGLYSAMHLIRRRHADPESLECMTECEYKANLQAMTSRLKEPGMTFEKLEDEVAAGLWLIAGMRHETSRIDAAQIFSSYIEENFPKLGDEFKEQITEKIFEIDKEYRRRCKEMTDRNIGHNL